VDVDEWGMEEGRGDWEGEGEGKGLIVR
jgi:hypothetical protein